MKASVTAVLCDMPSGQGRVPVAEVLGRMASELELLAGHMAQVDALLDQVLTEAHTVDHVALQQVDRLRQETEGLQHFVEALATTLQPDGSCDPVLATRVLKLRAQVLRLQGQAVESASNDLW